MKLTFQIPAMVAVLVLLADTELSRADGTTPKYTVQEIMKAVFKGDDALAKKIGKGNGSKTDFAKLEDYVTSLPLNDAPLGDPAGWKKKTAAVLEAVTALKTGKPGALAQYNLAVDCKSCHSVYRPE